MRYGISLVLVEGHLAQNITFEADSPVLIHPGVSGRLPETFALPFPESL